MRRFSGVAALLFASAAGCGKTTSLADAPTGDASRVDSGANVDAAPAPVTVITKSRVCCDGSPSGTLVAGVPVYAVQPSGAAGPSGQTDASGTVVLSGVEPGASMTAVYMEDATDYQLVTVVGVKPGDTITLGDQYGLAPPQTNTGTLTATFPAYTGAVTYQVFSPCNSANGGASPLPLAEGCTIATASILFLALDDGGNAIASGVVKNVPYTDGQTAALAAWTPAPAGGFQISVSGMIPEINQTELTGSMEVDGTESYLRSAFNSVVTPGTASGTLPIPIGGDRTFASVWMNRMEGEYGAQQSYTSVGPTATSATFTAPTMPWLGVRQLDAADQAVAWLQSGSAAYDGAFASLSYDRVDQATDSTTSYGWNILLPPGQTSFQWGTPIAALAPYVPQATDNFNSFHIQLVDLADATDYDTLRAVPEWQWQSPGNVTESGEVTGVSSLAYGAEGSTPTGGIRPGGRR